MAPAGSGRPRKRRKPLRRSSLTWERSWWERGVELVAGVDETGRGPLAGPVVAAAVILPVDTGVKGAVDSKQLYPEEREELAGRIFETAIAVGIGAASVREIDTVNILRASARAMRRALQRLTCRPGHVFVDGPPLSCLSWDHEGVVAGDAKVHSIACASIVAKVCRDRLMRRLSGRYPGYGWDHNAGYGTPEHLEAMRELGITPHHRRTFLDLQLDLELGMGGGASDAAPPPPN